MSIVHVNQIKTHILKKFNGLLDLSDLAPASDQQKENFQLSRSLAAYAVQYLAQTDLQSAADSELMVLRIMELTRYLLMNVKERYI
ncbi:MAG: hypothetical protein WC620_09745 [Methanoregula sp.]|jgi:hypothetical protein